LGSGLRQNDGIRNMLRGITPTGIKDRPKCYFYMKLTESWQGTFPQPVKKQTKIVTTQPVQQNRQLSAQIAFDLFENTEKARRLQV